jgi:hypothetical protein
MFLFSLIFLVVALVLIGVGFAIGLVACVLGACLLSLGVLSSSVFVGVRSGRPALALRAFLLQCGVLVGLPAGAVGAWLGWSLLASFDSSAWAVFGGGALGGAAAGLIIALLLDSSLRRLHYWAVTPGNALHRTETGGTSFLHP